MGTDFSGLVLAPAMAVFGRPVSITPLVSRPNVAPYDARGVWTVSNVSIPTEDGGIFSSVSIKLGIRLSEFIIAPKPGDWISVTADQLPLTYWQGDVVRTAIIDFIVDNLTPDGQGGAEIALKRVQ